MKSLQLKLHPALISFIPSCLLHLLPSLPLHFIPFFPSCLISLICLFPVMFLFFLSKIITLLKAFCGDSGVTSSHRWRAEVHVCACFVSKCMDGRKQWKHGVEFSEPGLSISKQDGLYNETQSRYTDPHIFILVKVRGSFYNLVS